MSDQLTKLQHELKLEAANYAKEAIAALRAMMLNPNTSPETARRCAMTLLQLAGLLPTKKPRSKIPNPPNTTNTPNTTDATTADSTEISPPLESPSCKS